MSSASDPALGAEPLLAGYPGALSELRAGTQPDTDGEQLERLCQPQLHPGHPSPDHLQAWAPGVPVGCGERGLLDTILPKMALTKSLRGKGIWPWARWSEPPGGDRCPPPSRSRPSCSPSSIQLRSFPAA